MKITLTWDGDKADLLKDNNGSSLADTIEQALDYASADSKVYHNDIRIQVERQSVDLLKNNNLRVEHSEDEDREPIDFDIRDSKTDERYASVWGSNPWNDIQADCEHPAHMIEYTDDDLERGVCRLCGCTCDWHWEKDEGNVDEYHWEGKVRVPHAWHGDCKSGIIRTLIDREKETF